jgi:hypothetical protein
MPVTTREKKNQQNKLRAFIGEKISKGTDQNTRGYSSGDVFYSRGRLLSTRRGSCSWDLWPQQNTTTVILSRGRQNNGERRSTSATLIPSCRSISLFRATFLCLASSYSLGMGASVRTVHDKRVNDCRHVHKSEKLYKNQSGGRANIGSKHGKSRTH